MEMININPVVFMRENIKGKSDISKCDHGNWFRKHNGECCFIEGIYFIDRIKIILTCGMLSFMKENEIKPEFNCQNCGEIIPENKLTELLLCSGCMLQTFEVKN